MMVVETHWCLWRARIAVLLPPGHVGQSCWSPRCSWVLEGHLRAAAVALAPPIPVPAWLPGTPGQSRARIASASLFAAGGRRGVFLDSFQTHTFPCVSDFQLLNSVPCPRRVFPTHPLPCLFLPANTRRIQTQLGGVCRQQTWTCSREAPYFPQPPFGVTDGVWRVPGTPYPASSHTAAPSIPKTPGDGASGHSPASSGC